MQAVTFTDTTPVLPAELWDPVTWTYTLLSPIIKPRNYHSVGILLPDGRVFCGGGGLCGSGPCRSVSEPVWATARLKTCGSVSG